MISFFVPGKAAPGGSKKPVTHPVTGKTVLVDDAKGNRSWKRTVARHGKVAYRGPLLTGPLAVTMTFFLPRPKGQLGTGRNAGTVRPSAPEYPVVKPDVLKLARSTEDALTGVVWRDDATTVRLTLDKRYAHPAEGPGPGVRIVVTPLQQVDL